MPIDPNIIMGIKPVQIANPLEQYMQVQQIQQAQGQSRLQDLMWGEKQRDVAADRVAADAMTSGGDVVAALAKAGYGRRAVEQKKLSLEAMAKQADIDKTGAETQAKRIETAGKQLDLAGQAFGWVKANPSVENAKAAINWLQEQGVYTPEHAARDIAKVDADPNNVAQLADMAFRAALSAKDQLPKIDTRNLGATTETFSVDPVNGSTKVLSTIKNSQSPDSVAADRRAAADRQARAERAEMTLTHGIKGLTPEQNDALFGENGAVTTGRLDPNRVNSRTAGIFADAELKRPGTDFSKISGDIALGRNATFRQRAMTAETLPEVMQNMVTAGKKVGFSDNRTIGKMQAWTKGEFNDPDMTAYMTMRNDALMTVAQVMRGSGMTDMAHRAETEAAAPTMSPAALDAWLKAQMIALQPRLDQNRRITRDAPVVHGATPPASPTAPQLVRKYNPATGRIE